MTKYAKIMVVFIVFACLAFMGISAAVTTAGRPNWDAERDKLAGDFSFESPTEAKPSWTVKSRDIPGQESFSKSSPVLADVVLAARAHLISQQQQEIESLEEEIAALEPRLAETKKLIEIDLKAMKKREDQLEVQIDDLGEEINQEGLKGIQIAQNAQTFRAEAELRREDVFRLRSQLDELETDIYQVREQRRKLRDQLVRMNGVLSRLDRRNAQLKNSVSKSDDYEPDSGAVK